MIIYRVITMKMAMAMLNFASFYLCDEIQYAGNYFA